MTVVILLELCAVTAVLEAMLFWLFGYRSRDEILVVVCTNVITTLLYALILSGMFFTVWASAIVIGELLVVASETAIYTAAFGRFRRVLILTIFANAVTFLFQLMMLFGDRPAPLPCPS